jgi:GTP-binding protein EngB required for normal cell division
MLLENFEKRARNLKVTTMIDLWNKTSSFFTVTDNFLNVHYIHHIFKPNIFLLTKIDKIKKSTSSINFYVAFFSSRIFIARQ